MWPVGVDRLLVRPRAVLCRYRYIVTYARESKCKHRLYTVLYGERGTRMTTFVELALSATDTALGRVFDRIPSFHCTMEQAAASEFPGLWLAGGERSDIETALDDDPSVETYTHVRDGTDEWLYKIRFVDEVCEIVSLIFQEEGTILSASADDGTWLIQLRFADHESATRVYHRLLDRDIDIDVVSLQKCRDENPKQSGLTPEQYEAIVTAVDRGYFEIPRQVSIQELADEFDISNQSVSERLRRASSTVLSTELNVEDAHSRNEDR